MGWTSAHVVPFDPPRAIISYVRLCRSSAHATPFADSVLSLLFSHQATVTGESRWLSPLDFFQI